MKKLSLQLDDLHVETFEPLPATGRRAGTVLGRGETGAGETCAGQQTCFPTCPGQQTCEETCPQTCLNTCDGNTCDASCLDTCEGASCGGTCVNTCNCE